MKAHLGHVILVLILVVGFPGYAEAEDDDIAGIIGVFTPITFLVVGLILYRIFKQRYQKDVYLAAIEKGTSIPKMPGDAPKTPSDLRKPALVLISVGLGFSIATFVTISFARGPDGPVPLQVSIWGIVPILIGVALWVYKQLAEKERTQEAESF